MDLLARMPKAALVTAVAFLFFGGSVGFVVAAGQDPLPENFGVEQARVGDRFEYHIQTSVAQTDDADRELTVQYVWGNSEILHDRDGIPRHVQPLIDVASNQTAYVDHETHNVIATAWAHDAELRWKYGTAVAMGNYRFGVTQAQNVDGTHDVTIYEPVAIPCGVLSELQGSVVSLNETVRVDGDCLGPGESQSGTLFEATGTTDWNNIPVVVFEASNGADHASIWYSPAVPYPLRMELTLSLTPSDFAAQGVHEVPSHPQEVRLVAEMTGFEAGDNPVGVPAGPLPAAFGTPDTAPLEIWGPNDDGIDVPYRMSEAFEGARTDPTFPDLREFLARNEDARTIWAYQQIDEVDERIDYRWLYVVWSEDESLYIESVRTLRHTQNPATGEPVEHTSDTHRRADFIPTWEHYVETEPQFPNRAPTVASAFMHFEEATGQAANEYGFNYVCPQLCLAGKDYALVVGHIIHEETEGTPGTSEGATMYHQHDRYRFDQDGRLVMREHLESEGTGFSLVSLAGSSPKNQADDAQQMDAVGAVWVAPPPAAAAGIGFVALLVGATYWFWPSLKLMPFFGMFSRVRPDEMLQNPIRAAIFEAIKENPGIHYQQLIRHVDKGYSVVDHHLRKLDLGNYISVQKGKGFTCFFAKGVIDHQVMMVVPMLRTEGARRVLREVVEHPGQSVADVARAVGITKSTVSYHVSRLRKVHLLEEGRPLMPTDVAEQALAVAA